jgi:hypothetical protein
MTKKGFSKNVNHNFCLVIIKSIQLIQTLIKYLECDLAGQLFNVHL